MKNKLDGSIYAIKAIRLSSKNQQMDKKMIREVKLLSKLNHENVVRYYTSWIERDSLPIDVSSPLIDSVSLFLLKIFIVFFLIMDIKVKVFYRILWMGYLERE